MNTPPLLAVSGIARSYGSVTALSEAGFALTPGRVSAIVGENGAGKSTLARIVTGLERPDRGRILLEGREVAGWSRRAAVAAGLGFVPQTLSLVPTLSLTENHLLGRPGWRMATRAARQALAETAEAIGIRLPLDVPAERLSLAERQLGEIVSALAAGARMLVLDEPTSALGPLEIDMLVATLRRLAGQGRAIGLITHRIAEVLEGADDVTVLKGGRVVMDCPTAGLEAEAVARLMVGERRRDHAAPAAFGGAAAQAAPVRLHLKALSVAGEAAPILDRISLSVRAGEILGVAGVSGAMQPALAQAIAGLGPVASGQVLIDGADVTGRPALAAATGLAHVPETRAEGLVPGLSLAENASLFHMDRPGFSRFGLRRPAPELALGREVIARHDVRPPQPHLPAEGLSGGNQQKLLVGRELARGPGVLVIHGPTQGLDLAAAAAIRGAIVAAAARGMAALVISADLDELIGIAHRMIVLANGRITAEFDLGQPVDPTLLGRAMTGIAPAPRAAPPRETLT